MISQVMDFLATPIFAFAPLRYMGGATLLVAGIALAVLHQTIPTWVEEKATLEERQWRAVKVGAGIAISYFLMGVPFLTHPLAAIIYAGALVLLGLRQANILFHSNPITEQKRPPNPITKQGPPNPITEQKRPPNLIIEQRPRETPMDLLEQELEGSQNLRETPHEYHWWIQEQDLPEPREPHEPPLTSDHLLGLRVRIISKKMSFEHEVVKDADKGASWKLCAMRHDDQIVRLLLAIEKDPQLLPIQGQTHVFHMESKKKPTYTVGIYFPTKAST